MIGTSAAAEEPGFPRPVLVAVGVALLAGITVAAVLAGNGSIIVAVAPVAGAALLAAIWMAPLRVSLMALAFLGLALDKPGDSSGLWQSPLAPIGGLLLDNLNKTTGIEALKFSGTHALIALLLLVRMRRVFASPPLLETANRPPARTMLLALTLSAITAAGMGAFGIFTGGDGQMVKIQLQMFIPMLALAYLFAVSLRGVKDYRILGILVLAAACSKAVMALWFRHITPPFVHGYEVEFATTHGDSLLFATATMILIAVFVERPSRGTLVALATIGPIIVAGMFANDRRLVWAQLLASVAALLALNPRGWATRLLMRTVTYGLPVVVLYVMVGWNSSSRIFAPLQTLHTMEDGTVDRSTFFRDIENYNLLYTFRKSPVVGTGFGHPFETAVVNDDISGFKEYPYLPHNSILGLWAFGGMVGFTGLFSAIFMGLMLLARSHRYSTSAGERVAAVVAIASIIAYVLHCWGDIGFTEEKGVFLVAPALAIAARLAIDTRALISPTSRSAASAHSEAA